MKREGRTDTQTLSDSPWRLLGRSWVAGLHSPFLANSLHQVPGPWQQTYQRALACPLAAMLCVYQPNTQRNSLVPQRKLTRPSRFGHRPGRTAGLGEYTLGFRVGWEEKMSKNDVPLLDDAYVSLATLSTLHVSLKGSCQAVFLFWGSLNTLPEVTPEQGRGHAVVKVQPNSSPA